MSLFHRNIILFLSLSTSSGPPPPTPGPAIPSAQTAFGFPLGALPPTPHNGVMHVGPGYPLPPVPPPGPRMVPPPPGPPPPPLPPPAVPSHLAGHSEGGRAEAKPVRDARSDLLSAIRIGEFGYRRGLFGIVYCWSDESRHDCVKLHPVLYRSLCVTSVKKKKKVVLSLIYCISALIRHTVEESPGAAGAAEQAGAGGERCGHHLVSTHCGGVQ